MQLKKLTLNNFKKFQQIEIDFAKGINVVLGNNEAGKSTINEALQLLLYTSPMSGARDVLNKKSWKSKEGYKLGLEFEQDGNLFTLIKDFANKRGSLKGDNGVSLTNPDVIQDYLRDDLHIPVLGIYLNSCFVRQNEIMQLDNNNDFKNALQNLVVEGDGKVDVNAKLIELEKQIKELQKGIKNNSIRPGPIKSLQTEISLLESQLKADRLSWENTQQNSSRLELLQKGNQELAQKISENEELLRKLNKISTYKKTLGELNEKLDKVIARQESLKKIEQKTNFLQEKINKDYAKFEGISNIDELLLKIKNLDYQIELTSGEIRNDTVIEESDNKSKISKFLLPAGALLISVILSVILNNMIFLGLGVILALAIFALNKSGKNKSSKTQVPDNKMPISSYSAKVAELEQEQQDLFWEFSVSSSEELSKQLGQYKGHVKDISDLQLQKKYLLNETGKEDLANESKVLSRGIVKIENDIEDEGLKKYDFSAEKINNIEFELEKMRKKFKQDEIERISLQAEIRLGTGSLEQLNILEEKLEGKKEQLAYYQEQVQVLTLVKDSIGQAFQETIHNSRGIIEKLINEDIGSLSLNRYKEIKVDESLGITVYSSEKGDWVEITQALSKGTIDQIYLLARIGFARAILGKNSMPFIFDDPFVNFDSTRLGKLKEILQKLALNDQIIILTHNKEYKEWGELIDL
jgi:DNA repair exonuclease SbcCD ATPase subunit